MTHGGHHPVDNFDYSSLVSGALAGAGPTGDPKNNRFQAEAVTTKVEHEDPSGVTHSVVSESITAASVLKKDSYEVSEKVRVFTKETERKKSGYDNRGLETSNGSSPPPYGAGAGAGAGGEGEGGDSKALSPVNGDDNRLAGTATAAEGEIVSSQTITSRSRTVETTTYSLEKDGGDTETRVEQKVGHCAMCI